MPLTMKSLTEHLWLEVPARRHKDVRFESPACSLAKTFGVAAHPLRQISALSSFSVFYGEFDGGRRMRFPMKVTRE